MWSLWVKNITKLICQFTNIYWLVFNILAAGHFQPKIQQFVCISVLT